MSVLIRVSTPVVKTPRVQQTAALYDVPLAERSELSWNVNLPIDQEPWQIGAIIGPSGSGKTTIAKHMFGDKLITGFDWPTDKSVLDAFPTEMGVKDIVGLFSSVGFGSVPAWIRPFQVLSNGEQFRVSMARALAEHADLVVIDEFTSVVDRQVAQVASHAVGKTIRRDPKRRLVVVSCHFDILEWLQPDWVYQPAGDQFDWHRLWQSPQLEFSIHKCDRSAWPIFARHHYLSHSIVSHAQCLIMLYHGPDGPRPVAFESYIHVPHPYTKNIKRGHRLVVLPDWQGIGLGNIFSEWCGQMLYEQGFRFHTVVSHPAARAAKNRSLRWKHLMTGRNTAGGPNAKPSMATHQRAFSVQRVTSTFVYVPSVTPKPANLPPMTASSSSIAEPIRTPDESSVGTATKER